MRMGIRGLCVIGLAVAGCGGTSAPAAKSPEAEAARTTAAAQARNKGDGSLTPEESSGFGVPALDRDWSGDDLSRAESVLADLSKRGYQILPKYQSERSGTVFARMTSAQNLELLRNKKVPVDERFPQAVEYSDASSRIFKLYLAAYAKRGVRANELIELIGMQLRLAVVMLELTDEWLAALKQDDPNYRSRMQGLEGMKSGLTGIVTGSIQTLKGRGTTQLDEITRLVGYMQETFPRIVPRLPLESRLEALVELARLRDDPEMQDLRPKLQELHAKVKAAMDQENAR